MSQSTATEPPGPTGLPVVGNLHQFVRDPFGFTRGIAEEGDVVRFRIGGRTQYLVTHPAAIERILATDHDRFVKGQFQRENLGEALGEGLLTAVGGQWRAQREPIDPAFRFDRIETYVDTMVDCVRETAAEWTPGRRIDVDAEMQRLTLRVLVRTLFGTDITRHERTIGEATDAITAMGDLSSPTTYLPDWLPTPKRRRATAGLDAIDDVIADLVTERRAAGEWGEDLLSVLVGHVDDGVFDESLLRDQLVTFLLAGHETTALALTYAWYLLGTHPSARERFHAEVDALSGRPTMADLEGLEYTTAVVDEAMRLYPPVPRLVREPTEPVTLRGYDLPTGSMLMLPQHVVHRDGRWWDDPDAFRPERFLGDRDNPRYAYFPFGGGPRRCIGMWFSQIEAWLALADIGRRYRLELTAHDEPEMAFGVTARPKDPIEAVVRRRDR